MTSEGEIVFWRGGELCVVDESLTKHVLHRESIPEDHNGPLLGRMLLLHPPGRLVFTVGDELWLVETNLRNGKEPMALWGWKRGRKSREGWLRARPSARPASSPIDEKVSPIEADDLIDAAQVMIDQPMNP